MMTEQDLTALAKEYADGEPDCYDVRLARGYLAILAERDALREQLEARTRVITPDCGCTCHSSVGCQLHTWTNSILRG